jgi:tRNA(fMet)-specific endonuclease VapC
VVEPLFLLDSNICIYVLEGLAPAVRDRIQARRPGEIVTSAVVYAEVVRGMARDDVIGMAKVESLFRVIPVLPFDQAAARVYVSIPFRRASFDRLIAAHALSLGLTVVTNNGRDYADVPRLKIENWMNE